MNFIFKAFSFPTRRGGNRTSPARGEGQHGRQSPDSEQTSRLHTDSAVPKNTNGTSSPLKKIHDSRQDDDAASKELYFASDLPSSLSKRPAFTREVSGGKYAGRGMLESTDMSNSSTNGFHPNLHSIESPEIAQDIKDNLSNSNGDIECSGQKMFATQPKTITTSSMVDDGARFSRMSNLISKLDSFIILWKAQQQGDESITHDILGRQVKILEDARNEVNFIRDNTQEDEHGPLESRQLKSETYISLVEPSSGKEHSSLQGSEDENDSVEDLPQHDEAEPISPEALSPERERYLSQVGDVDILKESLWNMEVEHARVLEEVAIGEILGQKPDHSSQRFLDGFESSHQNLLQRLEEAETKEIELRNAQSGDDVRSPNRNLSEGPRSRSLLKAPTFPKSRTSSIHSMFGKDDSFDESHGISFPDEGTPSRAAAQNFLTPHEFRPKVYENVSVSQDGESVDKKSFVDAWLFHRAQTIPAETSRLFDIHLRTGISVQSEKFKQQVLKHWSEDTNLQAETLQCEVDGRHDSSTFSTNGGDSDRTLRSDSWRSVGNSKQPFEPTEKN